MSIISNKNHTMSSSSTPFFHEFKKQASFFFKEKIKNARLALTDVTPAQLLTEEATNGNSWAPDPRTMRLISRAAFELDDYWRIVKILHKRLLRFDRKNWRVSYQAVILLENLLTHGPESVAEEFQSDIDAIREMESFQYIDERGFNWGLTVRKKTERVLKLLEERPFLKEERNRARKLTRGIEGFGSFCDRLSATDGSLKASSFGTLGRSNSHYNNTEEQNDLLFIEEASPEVTREVPSVERSERTSFKENIVPSKENFTRELQEWEPMRESNPLLGCNNVQYKIENLIEDHPFNNQETRSTASLLSARDEILQGC